MKQLIDLAGQVANAAGDSPVRKNARTLVDLLKRGVVAYSGLND
jgi:ATP-dependent RNA helicase HelY